MSRHIGTCAGDDHCGGSCVHTGIPAATSDDRCPDCGAANDEDHTRQCTYGSPGKIPKAEINALKGDLRYNSANLGELGRRVRLEHTFVIIDRFVERVERGL